MGNGVTKFGGCRERDKMVMSLCVLRVVETFLSRYIFAPSEKHVIAFYSARFL